MITQDDPLYPLECNVRKLLEIHGPMTGFDLANHLLDKPSIDLWKVCFQSNLFRITNCARYYLRYDITRENGLRLSPSILRDFLTFSLISLSEQRAVAIERSTRLANRHREISRRKMGIARKAIMALDQDIREHLHQNACFFISGDVAYFLGHDVPRTHSELETNVNGSDVDILVVYNRQMDPKILEDAEALFLKFKSRALRDPEIAEEIDFLFKPVERMIEQLGYSNIHEKIASKILYESFYLYGSMELYEMLLLQLQLSGTLAKIEQDFETALVERKQTVQNIIELSNSKDSIHDPEIQSLFYFSQERLEFQ